MRFNYCYGCMEPLEDGQTNCSHCGYDNSFPHNDNTLLPEGSILSGKYIVGRVLGKGGFGVTYLGFELNLNVKVAVKEYFPSGFSSRSLNSKQVRVVTTNENDTLRFEKGREAFQQEAKTLAMFNSPGIAHVRDYFLENDTAYIVMDFVDGVGLSSEIRKKGKIPWDRTVSLMLPLMPELERLHSKNLIHRDIKPDNLKIVCDENTGEERLVLLDFGAARSYVSSELTGNYTTVLTPGFAPLEQYKRRSHQGPYTDVYALCATMYMAISGQKPPDVMDLMDGDEELKPFRAYGLNVPEAVEKTIRHGMALKVEDRIPTMGQLYHDMSAAAGRKTDSREFSIEEQIYSSARKLMETGKKENLEKAVTLFEQIPDYQDSGTLSGQCLQDLTKIAAQEQEKIVFSRKYEEARAAMALDTGEGYETAEKLFTEISGWGDADALAKVCAEKRAGQPQREKYDEAVKRMNEGGVAGKHDALVMLKEIPGYRDADSLIKELESEKTYNTAKNNMELKTESGYKAALNEFRAVSGFRDADELAAECEKQIRIISSPVFKLTNQEEEAVSRPYVPEKKKSGWGIILLLLIVFAAVFLYVRQNNRNNTTAAKTARVHQTQTSAAVVKKTEESRKIADSFTVTGEIVIWNKITKKYNYYSDSLSYNMADLDENEIFAPRWELTNKTKETLTPDLSVIANGSEYTYKAQKIAPSESHGFVCSDGYRTGKNTYVFYINGVEVSRLSFTISAAGDPTSVPTAAFSVKTPVKT
ncbi:MAG: serine/threonine protein kinase, partial [Anaerolineaceae bacterium]|nr:serine/threonine protein kinase [Anaerolineaceae bacterium]